MTHAQMERELSRTTGESLATIRSRRFQLVEPPTRDPKLVDWDELDSKRIAVLPQQTREKCRQAA